jgi:preprotein translocase subunit SecB
MPPKKPTRMAKHDPYLEFIQTISLVGLGLDSCSCNISRVQLGESSKKNNELSIVIEANYIAIERASDYFLVKADCMVKLSDKPSALTIGDISCCFSALFNTSKEAAAASVERFAENEARLVFWPYMRQFISDITFKMSISPIILPLTSESKSPAKKATQ